MWRDCLLENLANYSISGKKLVHSLLKEGRLRTSPATSLAPPTTAEEWLWEALRSNSETGERKLTAVVASQDLADSQADSFIVSIHRLAAASWWQARSCSLRLERKTTDFLL